MHKEEKNPACIQNGTEDTSEGGKRDHYIAILNREKQWRYENPDLWAELERVALNEVNHQRKFSVQLLIERLRWHDRVDSDGKPVSISNDWCPIWARVLVKKHPIIKQYISMRSSVYDELL